MIINPRLLRCPYVIIPLKKALAWSPGAVNFLILEYPSSPFPVKYEFTNILLTTYSNSNPG